MLNQSCGRPSCKISQGGSGTLPTELSVSSVLRPFILGVTPPMVNQSNTQFQLFFAADSFYVPLTRRPGHGHHHHHHHLWIRCPGQPSTSQHGPAANETAPALHLHFSSDILEYSEPCCLSLFVEYCRLEEEGENLVQHSLFLFDFLRYHLVCS